MDPRGRPRFDCSWMFLGKGYFCGGCIAEGDIRGPSLVCRDDLVISFVLIRFLAQGSFLLSNVFCVVGGLILTERGTGSNFSDCAGYFLRQMCVYPVRDVIKGVIDVFGFGLC